jgi:hypothetical protein
LIERTNDKKKQEAVAENRIRRLNSIENFEKNNPDLVRKSHNVISSSKLEPLRTSVPNKNELLRNSLPSLN